MLDGSSAPYVKLKHFKLQFVANVLLCLLDKSGGRQQSRPEVDEDAVEGTGRDKGSDPA